MEKIRLISVKLLEIRINFGYRKCSNTEGSREVMIFTARKNLKLEVSDRQIAILIGCLLGDAYLTKLGKIQIEQSSKDYIDWKYQELASISYPNPPKEVVRFEKNDNRVTKSFRFWTRQYFRVWRDDFYQGSQKIFPKKLVNWLTPLSLAVWYMDDGCYQKFDCTLSTESFDLESREQLMNILRDFGIKSLPRGKGKIRIKSSSLKKFFELINPYIHRSMMYKLP
jgi:recombination protein RecA